MLCGLLFGLLFGLANAQPRITFFSPLPSATNPKVVRFRNYVEAEMANPNSQYGYRPAHSVMLFAITGNATFCNFAVRGVEATVTSEEALIAGGSSPEIAGDSYLEVGPNIFDVAATYDSCGSSLNASQKTRWANYANQSVWNVWHPSAATWGGRLVTWSGWSIDNPGNNYHYSFLQATMTWGLASQDPTWLNLLTTEKLPNLTNYWINPPDGGVGAVGGGSREGTGYGTAHMRLFEIYQYWKYSRNVDLSAASTHCRDTIDFWIHATLPNMAYFQPFGDQARVSDAPLYDYQRAVVVRAQALNPGTPQAARAAWWLNSISISAMTSGFNTYVDTYPITDAPVVPSSLYYFSNFTGAFFARNAWNSNATFFSFMAGPFTESHAAQEQGGFSLYSGQWLAVTTNIFTHSGINQETATHNVLRFISASGDVRQKYGVNSMVYSYDSATSTITINADLSVSMAPCKWLRKATFNLLTSEVHIWDNYTLCSGVTAAKFTVNTPARPTWFNASSTAYAGGLKMTVLDPPAAIAEILDWTTVDNVEYKGGFMIAFSGGTGSYHVKLEATNSTMPPTSPPTPPTASAAPTAPTAPTPPTAATASSAPTLFPKALTIIIALLFAVLM